jgi:multimeric flavodoxin WrbA
MQIQVINGNPKHGGFIAGALEIIAARLQAKGANVQNLSLAGARISDCTGCFHCLQTGECVLNDDMADIIRKMKTADGFVVGGSVRNDLTTACYKRFYERITYLLGFPLLLEDKYTLAVGAVGFAGGKAASRKMLGLQEVFRTRLSGFLFYSVGIPTRLNPVDVKPALERVADKLMADITNRRPRPFFDRLAASLDRWVMGKFMFKKSPATYRYVIDCWQKKGYW